MKFNTTDWLVLIAVFIAVMMFQEPLCFLFILFYVVIRSKTFRRIELEKIKWDTRVPEPPVEKKEDIDKIFHSEDAKKDASVFWKRLKWAGVIAFFIGATVVAHYWSQDQKRNTGSKISISSMRDKLVETRGAKEANKDKVMYDPEKRLLVFRTFQKGLRANFETVVYGEYEEELLKLAGERIEIVKPSGFFSKWWPIMALGVVYMFFMWWAQKEQMKSMMGKKDEKPFRPIDTSGMSWKDIAGYELVKRSCQELIYFLKNPRKFKGARMPRGIVFFGPPGTGKTAIAEAIAGEAGVPFYLFSGSEFIKKYIGDGAEKVRELFKEARKNAPCIIMVDEIDALGAKRDGEHREHGVTLNEFLKQMDGFHGNEGILVIATTNRIDMLDDAVLRPGRFDRQVMVGLPVLVEREAILELHIKKKGIKIKPEEKDTFIKEAAQITTRCSGADLEGILNEMLIYMIMNKLEYATIGLFIEIRMDNSLGKKRPLVVTDEEKLATARHEVGHVFGQSFCEHATGNISGVSIVPRERTLGVMIVNEGKDVASQTKEELFARMVMCAGGYAAEMIYYDTSGTGVAGDIKQSSGIALRMVTEFGMGAIGFVDANACKGFEEKTAKDMEELSGKAVEKATAIIKKYSKAFDAVVSALVQEEFLEGARVREIIVEHE